MRGYVARTHTNSVAKTIVCVTKIISLVKGRIVLKKITLVNKLITKILAYSAIKINANKPLLYSTLNPDTSSDSPSAKSNGVRLVSARFVINHSTINGINIIETHESVYILVKSMVVNMINALNRIRDILTS